MKKIERIIQYQQTNRVGYYLQRWNVKLFVIKGFNSFNSFNIVKTVKTVLTMTDLLKQL